MLMKNIASTVCCMGASLQRGNGGIGLVLSPNAVNIAIQTNVRSTMNAGRAGLMAIVSWINGAVDLVVILIVLNYILTGKYGQGRF